MSPTLMAAASGWSSGLEGPGLPRGRGAVFTLQGQELGGWGGRVKESSAASHPPPTPRDSPLSTAGMGKKESARVSQYAQGIEMRGSHKGVACSA